MKRKVGIFILAGFLLFFPLQVNAIEVMVESEAENEEITVPEEKVKVQELDLGDYLDTMTVGEKQLLSVTVLPMDASNATITYSSSDINVATINGKGRITAVMLGKTTITASVGEVSQSFGLEVKEKEDTTIHVTDIEIGEHESEVEVEKMLTLFGTTIPSDATNATITYTSSNPAIATVSSTGEVKGISKGDVIITLSADGFSKAVPLTVKVATAGININKDYVVLKSGGTCQLSASITPAEANQAITYHSVDPSIASVSQGGKVAAKGTGSTTVIVSNGDISVAVSVIVNKSVVRQEETVKGQTDVAEEKVYAEVVNASEQKIIDSEMLRYLYETKKILKIKGDGYVVEIDGKDIVNYENEFFTDIELFKESGKIGFLLNKGNELCGAVTVCLEKPKGKYLYLYNSSKEKYELLNISDKNRMKLTTAGEYQLCESKIRIDKKIIIYGVSGGTVIVLIGGMVYVFVKKKYWFW